MKRFKLHLAMFLALGIVATGFSGCAKDYDDEIRRIENGAQENLEQLRTELTGQLDAVKQQIWVLENTTMPAAIKEEADKVRTELAAVQTALEARIAALERSQDAQDIDIQALKDFKSATDVILLDYGTRIGVLESQIILINGRIDGVDDRLTTLTTDLSKLKGQYDAFIQSVLPTLATKTELNKAVEDLQREIAAALEEAMTAIEDAEERANKYTDDGLAALKQAIDDAYGDLLPDMANLLDKLGVDADGNLVVIDELTDRVTALEDLNINDRLAAIEAEWDDLLFNVSELLGRMTAIEDFRDDILNNVIPDIISRLDAIDQTGGLLEQLDTRLTTAEGDIKAIYDSLNAIGNMNDGLLGQLFTTQADHASRIQTAENNIQIILDSLATKADSEELQKVKDSLDSYKQMLDDHIAQTQERFEDVLRWAVGVNNKIDSLATVTANMETYFQEEIDKINEAISGTGGILERLTALENGLTALTLRVDALEEKVDALLNRIQSLTFVPANSSGGISVVKAGANYEPFTTTFLVTPADKAAAIGAGIADGSIEAKFIVNETTRAITTAVTFTITTTTAVGSADGTVSFTVTPAGLEEDMFYQIALQLTDSAEHGTNVTTSFIPVQAANVFEGAVYTPTHPSFSTYITTPVRKWYQGASATGDTALVPGTDVNILHCLVAGATTGVSVFNTAYNTGDTNTNGINILPVMQINGLPLATFAANYQLDINKFTVVRVNPITEYLYDSPVGFVDNEITNTASRKVGVTNDGRLRPYGNDWTRTYTSGYSKASVEFIFSYDGTELWREFAYIQLEQ